MRSFLSAVALVVVLAFPSFANAATYYFSISQNGDEYNFAVNPATGYLDTDSQYSLNFYKTANGITESYAGSTTNVPPYSIVVGYESGFQTIGFGELVWTTPDYFDGTTFIPTTPGSPVTVLRYNDSSDPYLMTITIGPDIASTPEPSSIALLGTGILGVAGAVRRRIVRA